jgi:hypothetical protein
MKYGTIGVIHGQRGPFTYRVPDDPEVCPLQHSKLSTGEFVIVKSRYGYGVGEVFEVHDEPQDDDPSLTYAWAFQKVDEEMWEKVQETWMDSQ